MSTLVMVWSASLLIFCSFSPLIIVVSLVQYAMCLLLQYVAAALSLAGKSAILHACQVVFGAKASDTSRGSSLVDLIRNGTP